MFTHRIDGIQGARLFIAREKCFELFTSCHLSKERFVMFVLISFLPFGAQLLILDFL